MARPKPGGNVSAMSEHLKEAADILRNGVPDGVRVPFVNDPKTAAEALKGNCSLEGLKAHLSDGAVKQNGLLAGGAVVAADGLRRAFTKDGDGKRHLLRGTVQTAAGIGLFTAGLAAKRAGMEKDSTPSR